MLTCSAELSMKIFYNLWPRSAKTTGDKSDITIFHPREIIDIRGNSVDPDEMVHGDQTHQDLHCLQIQLFSFWIL